MATKKRTKSKARETTLRHLWLAGLGAVALVRRETMNAANDAVAKVQSLKHQAGKMATEAETNVRDGITNVRQQGEAKASQFGADVEARLAPILVKLGLKPKARKASRGRKPAKKAVAKRARSTPTRKPAAKRVVRKKRG